MRKTRQRWNNLIRLSLVGIVIIGILASVPLIMSKIKMEDSAKQMEYIFDYRDLLDVAEFEPQPQKFVEEQLQLLQDAGVTTMAVYESSLRELMSAGRLVFYNEKEMAQIQGKVTDPTVRQLYIVYAGEEEAKRIGPIVEQAFDMADVKHRAWSFEGRPGLMVDSSVSNAVLKPMDYDPMALEKLQSYGFSIVARPTDRLTYDSEYMRAQLERLQQYGVKRLLFDGDSVPGAFDQEEMDSIDHYGKLLNEFGMGLVTIENLKAPQIGFNKLAYLTDYNVVRLYSLSPEDSLAMTPEGIADRFLLAAKDRNIRMFFLNAGVKQNVQKNNIINSATSLAETMGGETGVIAQLTKAGFPAGETAAFDYNPASWHKYMRAIVAIGAIALIALLIGAFLPALLLPVFLLGVIGSAGLFVLNSALLEQALALGAAVAAPTLGLIWVMNRVYARTIGDQRVVGGNEWVANDGSQLSVQANNRWIFPEQSLKRRLGLAFNWFVVATVISLSAVPLITGLLNNITYSLVLQQFRGVSVLHFGPLVLVAAYIFFYQGKGTTGVWTRIRQMVAQPITVLWVVIAAVLGVVGLYYLSRTGNAGQVSAIEMLVRGWLESTFGVRPRFKEFLLGHPALLFGLFLALRYRASWLLIIVGAFGQLTMVSSFTHLHTPFIISAIRTALGLGVGIIVGCILIAAWTILEGVIRKWMPKINKKVTE
ncbi:DUF5693 family protein [Paenibacillus yanchengensis]|uniref:DUF5693 family protein n=1 Tax=Paenibacillus yanchengensis TaxID=2035833 RepID=A0ABW4YMY3_9BACL